MEQYNQIAKKYPNREAVLAMREHEKVMKIHSQYLPKSPVCGGPMQLHVPVSQAYRLPLKIIYSA